MNPLRQRIADLISDSSLYEQGREDTELVKIDGKWLIKRRYISSDSGLPDKYDATYKPRENPLK